MSARLKADQRLVVERLGQQGFHAEGLGLRAALAVCMAAYEDHWEAVTLLGEKARKLETAHAAGERNVADHAIGPAGVCRAGRRRAWVTSYLMLVRFDGDAPETALPNHGLSRGHRILRVLANRWHVVRIPEGWCVKARKLFPMDGSEPARALLHAAVSRPVASCDPQMPERTVQ